MRILFFISKTVHSNTKNLSDAFLKLSYAHDVSVVTEKDMKGHCNGCNSCFETGVCRYKDRLSLLLQEEYDALFIASPVYFFGLSSVATQFLHRTYMMNREGLVIALILSHGSSGYFGGVSLIEEAFKRLDDYSGSITVKPFHKCTNDNILECTDRDVKGLKCLLERVQLEVNKKYEDCEK